MKELLASLLIMLVAVTVVSADSISALEFLPETPYAGGNYAGASWKLTDSDLALTGAPLTQTTYLTSVTFLARVGIGNGTSGDIYLKVFEGGSGGTGTFVGVSTNTVDAYNADGEFITWNFDNLALDKDTVYSYVAGLDNTSGNPSASIAIQVKWDTSNTYMTSGSTLLPGDSTTDHAAIVKITTTDVPEPATMILLGFGGFSFFVRRRKKCNSYNCRR